MVFGSDSSTANPDVICNDKNSMACETATSPAAATTAFVAFVDADVDAPDDWLTPLLTHFADPRVALVAPRVRGAGGTSWLARFETWRSPLDLGPSPARIRSGSRVSYVPAAALVVPLLALPQLTHYVLDGFVWRRSASDHFRSVADQS